MKSSYLKVALLLFFAGLFVPNETAAIGGPYIEEPEPFGLYDMELGNPDAGTPKDEIKCTITGTQCLVHEF